MYLSQKDHKVIRDALSRRLNESRRGFEKNSGYILLFTLGVLAVISVLILSMTLSLRMDAQLVSREKSRLQDEYTLRGAVQYVIARLGVTLESQRQMARKSLDSNSQRTLWSLDEGLYPVRLDGADLLVSISDGGSLPDANLLTEPEWQRLFVELGADGKQSASSFARAIIEARLSASKTIGGAGFESLSELTGIQSLPPYLTQGEKSVGRPSLIDLLVIGTELKQLEINQSPLVLFKVLAGFDENKADTLKLTRSRGTITLIEGQKLLIDSRVKLMTNKSEYIRVEIYFQNSGNTIHGMRAIALLQRENNIYKLKNQLIREVF